MVNGDFFVCKIAFKSRGGVCKVSISDREDLRFKKIVYIRL